MKREFSPEEPEAPRLDRCRAGGGLLLAFLRCWLRPGGAHRVLDLATGDGALPRLMVDWARRHSVSLRIDAVDSNPSTLEAARALSADYPEIAYLRGDARTFDDQLTYDLVHSSLSLHRFSEADAVRILRRMRALSHDKVLLSDLERSLLSRWSVWLLASPLLGVPAPLPGARLSVRRAFSFQELEALALEAGWSHFGHRRFLPARQALWLRKLEVAPLPLAPALDFAT